MIHKYILLTVSEAIFYDGKLNQENTAKKYMEDSIIFLICYRIKAG